ncbi:tricarboxylate transport protein TctC [Geomicrobium sp. JCM 19038]|nr:tricarboxylate transport protein TctC [Geomicrobium sp. JCM 19038]
MTARNIETVIREEGLLDVDFTVTNVDGASAGNGMNEVRNADPDGHTLLHHHTSLIAHKATGVRDWGYEVYEPVAQLFEVPHVIFTHPDYYDDVDAFISEVEQGGEGISMGTSSPGGLTHMNMMIFLDQLGVSDSVVQVTHGGGGDLNTALLAGENNIGIGQLPQHIDYHRSGDLKILAVSSSERMEAISDIPTFEEIGLDGSEFILQTMGVWAPPETPDPIINELYDLYETVVEHEKFIEAANQQGFTPALGDGEVLSSTFEQDELDIETFLSESGLLD